MRVGRPPAGASVLTVRVSHDGGRTYSAPAALAVPHTAPEAVDVLAQLRADTDRWPPCRCPQHRAAADLSPVRS
ncbi:hypothetical protein OOK44_38160 [Streptomyces cellulosae]|uniref:hypothetical protein n=1 Tax=Streptomyces cellulosae TaxID=1968 RepID=UPI00225249E9|nr:hypothetical protein [Streptomyces cellulosae]MCX4482202.1 hypothetical protein [Streptomyces cellulosae]